ncbi:MAG: DinB family protein [Planctomycetota bacterium]
MIDRERAASSDATAAGDLPPALGGCIDALGRTLQLLERIDDAGFVAPGVDGGTVGAHLRHCIEYFRCFLTERETGLVEYDARARDPELERSRALAGHAIRAIVEEIRNRREDDLDREVTILQSLAPGAVPERIRSSARREWMALADHTIHHIAIITQLLAAGPGPGEAVEVASRLGVAFSTQAHRDELGEPAVPGNAPTP